MALNPQKWTNKLREAFSEANTAAASAGNPCLLYTSDAADE